jgi:hypothetical protein
MFGRSWEKGTATIIEKHVARAEQADSGTKYKYVVDIEVPGSPRFRTTMKDPASVTSRYLAPAPGQVVSVKVDTKREKAKFDTSDPGLSTAAGTKARLEQLAALKEQGRIPAEVYERYRDAVADGTIVIDGRRSEPLDIEVD